MSHPVDESVIALPQQSCLLDEYLRLPRQPQSWVIENIIPAGGYVNLYGKPKCGKSYLGIQIAAAIAGDAEEWMGFEVKTHGPVLYVQLDTPRPLWAERFEKLMAVVDLPGICNVSLADSLQVPYPFDILSQSGDALLWLRAETQRLRPVVVIIDTLRELHRGDENDSACMVRVLSHLVTATRPAALVLISHSRKEFEGANTSLMESNRGSNYIAGRMDTIMKLSRRTLTYQGRTIDEHSLPVVRDESGLWTPDNREFERHLEQVTVDDSLDTQIVKARKLAELSGRSIDSCRGYVQRRMYALKESGGVLHRDMRLRIRPKSVTR